MGEFSWDKIPISQLATENPVAGAEYADITVPTGKRWKVVGVLVNLVTDATVSNRTPQMYFKDATHTQAMVQASNPSVIAASTNGWRSWVTGSLQTTPTGYGNHIAPIELPAGAYISFTTANLQVGDNYGVGRIWYKEAPA